MYVKSRVAFDQYFQTNLSIKHTVHVSILTELWATNIRKMYISGAVLNSSMIKLKINAVCNTDHSMYYY